MPLPNRLAPLRDKISSFLDNANPASGQRPPPVPPRPSVPEPFYCPTFSPSTTLATLFEYNIGAGLWGNDDAQYYTDSPNNSFCTSDGNLVIRAVADRRAEPGRVYTSARLVSRQTLKRPRGHVSIRLQAPSAVGIWPAVWALPCEPFYWPEDGEIDIFEAWNGVHHNHSCLHWGNYVDPSDKIKHRMVTTDMGDVGRLHEYAVTWDQPGIGEGGRMVWYVDGRAVMKADRPRLTRRMEDYQIIFNIAMGGTVCDGKLPKDGVYDMVIHRLAIYDDPPGGWERFEEDYRRAPQGTAL